MGEANRNAAFRPDPNQRYSAVVKTFGQEKEFIFSNVISVGMDKDGRVVIVAEENTNHIFPLSNVEYYNFTKN